MAHFFIDIATLAFCVAAIVISVKGDKRNEND